MTDDIVSADAVAVDAVVVDEDDNFVLQKDQIVAAINQAELTKGDFVEGKEDVINNSRVHIVGAVFRILFGYSNKSIQHVAFYTIPVGTGNLELAAWYAEREEWLSALSVAFEAETLEDGEPSKETIEDAKIRALKFVDAHFPKEIKIPRQLI